ncbi:hypothetical protein R3Q15_22490 [Gordonia amicalis]|uniref:Uncharacterized protein n=1 Tax=Gordonia amicalis TaxID=89053 RepID=A0AAE4R7Q9_9ACTN|nr:hypothetical protein [Gordonia amicalis]MDV6314604.1 hypothetical protein [Gordonia amicalis]
MSDVRLKSSIGHRGVLAAVMVVAVSVLAVLASLVLPADPASAETPAERCVRETAAYNSAWAQTWAASNGRPASEAPPPPVPYVCHDPGPTTTTTSQPPVVTAPTVPSDTNVPEGPGPNMGAHAPTDIPPPGSTPIVPIPTTGARDLGDDGDREGGDPRRTDPSRERPIPDLGSFRHNVDDDYDTNEIVGGPWEDTCGNKVPLRRGYWNGKRGRGWDKIYHYHKMTNMDVVQETIESNCGEHDQNDTRGRTLIYRQDFYRQECSYLTPGTLICEKKPPPVTYRAVVQMSDTLPNGEKIPGGASGVTTAYCEGYVECPGWMSSPKQIDKVSGIPLNGNDGGDAPVA